MASSYREDTHLFARAEFTSTPAAERAELGSKMRAELREQWACIVDPSTSSTARDRTAQVMKRWLPVLTRPGLFDHPENAPMLVGWLEAATRDTKLVVGPIVSALGALARLHPLDEATRLVLTELSRREEPLGWSAIVDLAMLGLPESIDEVERLLPNTDFNNHETVARHQARILEAATAGHRALARRGLRALYVALRPDQAEAALTALAAANASDEAWAGAALGVLARPALQAIFLRALAAAPRPSLRRYVEALATHGALSVEAQAKALLATLPPTYADPVAPLPLPWSPEQRAALARLAEAPAGTLPDVAQLGAVQRLYQAKTPGGAELLGELAHTLAPRLAEAPIQALLVEVMVETGQRRVLVELASLLLARRLEGLRIGPDERERIAARAPNVRNEVGCRLALARLALPTGIDPWSRTRAELLGLTGVPEEDLAIGLDLATTAPEVLTRLLSECTPNQRRLLLARAPLTRFPQGLPALYGWLVAHDPANLTVLCDRLVENTPAGALDLLRALASSEAPLSVRQRAVESLGRLGDREELTFLAALDVAGLDTGPARKTIIERLRARGEHLDAGGLELVSPLGALALHDGAPTPTPPPREAPANPFSAHPAATPTDRRMLLAPPPRPWNPVVVLMHLLLGANGWGALWTNTLALMIVFAVSGKPNPWLLVLSAGAIVLNHTLAETSAVLRALRHGVMLVATVSITTSRTHGKNSTTKVHHRFSLLDGRGRTSEHTITRDARMKRVGDETVEHVLAVLDKTGRPTILFPLDGIWLVRVSARGRFTPSARGLILLGLSLVPWLWLLLER